MLDMLKSVFSNLSRKPVTRMYPFEERKPFDINRGHLENNIDECIFCGMCQRVCPSNCIKIDRKTSVWEYNPFECVLCGVCVEKCPKKCLKLDVHYRSCTDKKYNIHLEKHDDSEKAGA